MEGGYTEGVAERVVLDQGKLDIARVKDGGFFGQDITWQQLGNLGETDVSVMKTKLFISHLLVCENCLV